MRPPLDGGPAFALRAEKMGDLAPEDDSFALADRVAEALQARRRLSDESFDQFLPADLRAVSSRFWTPLRVIARATQWLTELRVRSVVDIGSGVGKFCVAGALGTDCTFTGIEHRPRLASVARSIAGLFNLEGRVDFVTGAFGEVPIPAADCYYLFNPFGENLFPAGERLNDDADLSHARYLDDIDRAERLLSSVPIGGYVITYNGFGGTIPADFEEVRIDVELPCVLRMARRHSVGVVSLPRADRGSR
jgi:SAM-dependent methyltransferase